MKISSTRNQSLTDKLQSLMARKRVILRSAKSISDRLLGGGTRLIEFRESLDEIQSRLYSVSSP